MRCGLRYAPQDPDIDVKGVTDMLNSPDNAAGPPATDMTESDFNAERDRVCAEFSQKDSQHQPGQLTGIEYSIVGVLLVVAFVLVLVFQ